MCDSRLYPTRPWLGVAALIKAGDQIVLVEQGKAPLKGIWSLPGGAVESGESLADAIKREILEETGLDIVPSHLGELVDVIRKDDQGRPERHFVLAIFVAESDKLSLVPGDDAAQAEWVSLDNLKTYPLTDGTEDVIQRLLNNKSIPYQSI